MSEAEPSGEYVEKPSEEITTLIKEMGVDNVGEEDDGATEEELAEEAKAEDTSVGVDKAFLKFQKRVLREPEQVLR